MKKLETKFLKQEELKNKELLNWQYYLLKKLIVIE